jgi:SAM-dependent methyltransferase
VSGGFPAAWLALRESYDVRAADPGLVRRLAAWAAARRGPHVVDLGAGTGSTLRRLAPLLPAGQRWTLVEIDPALIAVGEARLAGAAARYRRLDLRTDLEVSGEEPADLLTASALLDLVPAAWLQRLVTLRERLGCALYASLTYDGDIGWQPADPVDDEARDAVNRHQRTDKGLGPALGPEAAFALHRLLAAAGGALELARSDWRLGPGDGAVQRALLAGYLEAASATAPSRAGAFRAWHGRRLRHLEAGRSELTVGHLDLLYLPAASRRTA